MPAVKRLFGVDFFSRSKNRISIERKATNNLASFRFFFWFGQQLFQIRCRFKLIRFCFHGQSIPFKSKDFRNNRLRLTKRFPKRKNRHKKKPEPVRRSFQMVRPMRLERTRPKSLPPQSSVSADSTTASLLLRVYRLRSGSSREVFVFSRFL